MALVLDTIRAGACTISLHGVDPWEISLKRAHLKIKAVIRETISYLTSEESSARAISAECIGTLGYVQAFDSLIDLLIDEDVMVRIAEDDVLIKMTLQDFDHDAGKWSSWRQEHKSEYV